MILSDKISCQMISVVIPVYNEENNVIPLYQELKEVFSSISKSYEVIFVDDGSTDNTLRNLLSLLSDKENPVRIIELRNRFRKSAALVAGFKSVKGGIVVTLDGDGQDDPNDIPKLLKELTNDVDVVCGWRYKRKDSLFFKKIPSAIYNFLNRLFNRLDVHDSDCMLRVYRKEAVSEIILLEGDHRYIPAILHNRGFKLAEVKVNHRKRNSGKSKYGSKRLFAGLADLFTVRFLFRFGQRPMHLFSGIGVISLLIALGLGIFLLVIKYAYGQDIGDRPLLLLTILLGIAGLQFFFTGFLAELVVRQNTTSTDLYSIKKIHDNADK